MNLTIVEYLKQCHVTAGYFRQFRQTRGRDPTDGLTRKRAGFPVSLSPSLGVSTRLDTFHHITRGKEALVSAKRRDRCYVEEE